MTPAPNFGFFIQILLVFLKNFDFSMNRPPPNTVTCVLRILEIVYKDEYDIIQRYVNLTFCS